MSRAYSGVLGGFGLSLTVLRGLWLDLPPALILTNGLVVFFVFAFIGFSIGKLSLKTRSELEENRFEAETARHNLAAASNNPDL